MLRKRSRNDDNSPAKKRNLITFEMKLDMVKRFENKERPCDIARTLNVSQSTVRTILVRSEKIKERSKRLLSLGGTKFIRPRSHTVENMEKRLAEWIKFETERDNRPSIALIQEKARELYETIRVELNDAEAKPFAASFGWLDRFKKRMKLFQLDSQEVVKPATVRVVNMDIVNKFPSIFKEILDEGGYSPKQVFSINEFGLFWRRLPTYDPFSKIESQPDNDRLVLILGANALGDYKLKPVVVFHKSNPVALTGYSKDHLPVVWKCNPKGTVTSSTFSEYYCNRLTNELKDYCLKENIPFKILLVLSSASHHPECLEDFSENIKVVFLPPNTESCLLPMDSDIIHFFNAHYFHLLLEKLIEEMENDERKNSIEVQRRNFNIKNAVDMIGQAWTKINQNSLKCLWYRLWPEHAGKHKSFEFVDGITKLKQQIISLAETINIEVDIFKVSNALMPPEAEITPEELRRMIGDDDENNDDDYAIRTLSSEDLYTAFAHIQAAITIFDENDYNRERSFKVMRQLESAIGCYKQMYTEKIKSSARIGSVSFVKVEAVDDDEKLEYDEPEIQSAKDGDSVGSEIEYQEDAHDPIG